MSGRPSLRGHQREAYLAKIQHRIEQRRSGGRSPAEIAQYVFSAVGEHDGDAFVLTDLQLTVAERRELQTMRDDLRVRQEARAREAQWLAAKRATEPAPTERHSIQNGLGQTSVCQVLDCTLTELNRWAKDGRLPPDGEKFFPGVGPLGGNKWGRAWLLATVEAARASLLAWRQQDSIQKTFKRRGLKSAASKPRSSRPVKK